jgi:hypothetical protein
MGVLVLLILLVSVFFSVSNSTLLWRGLVNGDWYIRSVDFFVTIVLQLLSGLTALAGSTAWLFGLFAGLLRRPIWTERTMRLVLVISAGSLFVLFLVHHWFELIICARGALPGECGL